MSELTERLHAPCDWCHDHCTACATIMVDAADAITDLEAQLAATEAALKPFAKVAKDIDPRIEDYMAHHYDHLVGHYRAAALAARWGAR